MSFNDHIKRDFLLSTGVNNHREHRGHRGHRGHREKRYLSVLSVYSVVDQLHSDSFSKNKFKNSKPQMKAPRFTPLEGISMSTVAPVDVAHTCGCINSPQRAPRTQSTAASPDGQDGLNMILEKKARKKIILIAFLTFIFLALAGYYYLLPGIASFLTVETNLPHSDVIIILGGDSERVPYGVKLYYSNYSDKIIVTGGLINIPHINITWAELEKEEAIDMGVPQNDILLVDNSNTAYEDAQFSREIMLQNNFTSAIVVSSPYHMRRAAWIFGKIFKDDSIKLFYSPVEDSWFKPDKWWTDERKMHVIMDEYAKFVYYLLKGF